MCRYRLPSLIILVLFSSSVTWAATLGQARQLHDEGRTEEALAMIESILSSDAAGDEKAAALDLLGTIAVDKGYFSMAKQAWTQLVDEYPDYAADNDVGTKLRLVSALLMAEKPEEPQEPQEPEEPVAEAVAPEAPTAAPEPETAPRAKAVPAAEAEPAPTVAAAKESSGLVFVAAKGKPHDAVTEASKRLVAYLRERGVDATSPTEGIPVVTDSKMVLPLLFQKGQQEGAGSVVLLTADFVTRQKMSLECFLPEGATLWKVKVSGGTGWKGRSYSQTGITEPLLQRFLEKLGKKIGGPGLPVTLD